MFVGVLALLAGASAAFGALYWCAPDPGVVAVIAGYEYPLSTASSSALEGSVGEAISLRTRQLLDHEVYLDDGHQVFPIPARGAGYFIDQGRELKNILESLGKAASSRSPTDRAVARILGRPLRIHAELQIEVDRDQARLALERLKLAVDRAAVDAQLLISEHEILPSQVGRQLSIEGSLLRLERDKADQSRRIELCVDEVLPMVTEEALAPVDVTRVLSSYETSFRGKAGPRAVNIRAAGRYLNGAVILPGETLSFNGYVGRRIPGRGFVDAPVIINDELEEDVGGGVCQVATTLHAAAIFGNLEVVARRSHSRPSGYAPLGLDATVIDGKVDLELRNPYPEPLLVHVSFPSTYVIRVELLGRSPALVIKHESSVTHREPFARRIWNRPEVAQGTFDQKQKGIDGMDVVSVLTIQGPEGHKERRTYRSKYYPVPEVFWLGPGVSLSELPQPAKTVTQVVVDGIEPAAAQRRGSANDAREGAPPLEGRNEVL